jgi:NAD(P)H-binding
MLQSDSKKRNAMRILVVGGTGFVGSHFCKQAILAGHEVYSLSRRGKLYENDAGQMGEWASQVEWIKGDVMNPEDYQTTLTKVDSVVHSMGILLENPYYQDLALHPLNSACNLLKQGQLPIKPFRTYQSVNCDSTVTLATACLSHANIKNFAFVSATHATPPFLPKGYIEAKIQAENILKEMPIRSLIFRPSILTYECIHLRKCNILILGLMYSDERMLSVGLAKGMNFVTHFPGLSHLAPWACHKALPVQCVGKAILKALEEKHMPTQDTPISSQTIYETDDIENLCA